MLSDPVVIVLLRQPRRHDPREQRADPYWEFGSFGTTGCHAKTLTNPRRAARLDGLRLAFAQGGPLGFRLVYLTPPVEARVYEGGCEAWWAPAEMPFRYACAPLLVDNDAGSDCPCLRDEVGTVNRTTWLGRFASRYRANCTPLPAALAAELVEVYDRHRASAGPAALASTYEEALPYPPPEIDAARAQSYHARLAGLGTRRGQ